jgi:hypothetical protein
LTVVGPLIDGDFNDDGFYDCLDVDALVSVIAAGSHELLYDLTGDTFVTIADLDVWRSLAGAANIGPGREYLVGDANLDGVVDGVDFIEWNSHKFTSTAAWCDGDFNADGVVDGLDFILWNDNKFSSSDQVVANVPEPISLWLFLSGLAIFLCQTPLLIASR